MGAGALDRLAEVIEAIDCDAPSNEEVAALLACADRLQARVTCAIERFDAADGWALDGALSLTAWLRGIGGLSGPAAARLARTARRLRDLPVIAAAWRDGRLSAGHVEAICGHVTDATVGLLGESEAEMVTVLAPLSVKDTATVMTRWQVHAEALSDNLAPVDDKVGARLAESFDGAWHLDATLTAEGAALVATAMRVAASDDVEGEPARSFARRQADALVDLCRWYLDHRDGPTGSRHRPHLNLVQSVTDAARGGCAELVGELTGRATLDPVTSERLACDAMIHRVVSDGASAILDYGRATRVVSAPLWNALVLRDRHCRFPGCDRPAHWAEGHHVRRWPHGGITALDNLVVLCTRHHHLCHLPGWQMKLLPDATVEVSTPAGKVLTSHPPPLPS